MQMGVITLKRFNVKTKKQMEKMEHNAINGHISIGVTIIMGNFARIDIDQLLKNGSTIISIIAGIFAIRYYIISTKNKKNGSK